MEPKNYDNDWLGVHGETMATLYDRNDKRLPYDIYNEGSGGFKSFIIIDENDNNLSKRHNSTVMSALKELHDLMGNTLEVKDDN